MVQRARGFTLMELMIVVAIISVLSALAIPNFVKYQLRSKAMEFSTNLEGLRKAEEALRQGERPVTVAGVLDASYSPGSYWNLGGVALPAAVPGTGRTTWTAAERALANGIDWEIEGATYYQYQVSTGGPCKTAGVLPNSGICFFAGARADIDGDGVFAEAALHRSSATGLLPASPAIIQTAWPGTLGDCLLGGGGADGVPCSLTSPDVF